MKRAFPPLPKAPAFRAAPLGSHDGDQAVVLTDRQREEVARIGMRLRLPARMIVYDADADARWVFVVAAGAVKCYRDLPSGKRAVGAFLFERDLFGLAENGRYMNTAQAITDVTLFRLPLDALLELLAHDGKLQLAFLAKVTHELRAAQRRVVLLDRPDPLGRLAMFISMMREHPACCPDEHAVTLPMSRADIAAFLGVSPDTISRAAAELERREIVRFETRHLARVTDPAKLQKLAMAV